jgi:dihydroneopterin aldolase
MSVTRFLASVRDEGEAALALAAGADIIDLKDPDNGALGAVAPPTMKACLTRIAGRAPVSATVGDLPLEPGLVARAVESTAASGADDVKLGVPQGGDAGSCFAALRRLDLPAGLILVFFADAMADVDPPQAARAAGARGLMLDTAGKGDGALPDYMSIEAIAHFVEAGRAAGLMVGLAGALRAKHLADLLALRPDVLGFRGGLCRDGVRNQGLDPAACGRIRALIPGSSERDDGRFREAPAAALC